MTSQLFLLFSFVVDCYDVIDVKLVFTSMTSPEVIQVSVGGDNVSATKHLSSLVEIRQFIWNNEVMQPPNIATRR